MRKILTLLFMVAAWLSFAQTGNVGVNTTTPDAVLEVYSTTKGVLVPRLTTTQRDAMVSPLNSAKKVQEGTIIYNLDQHCLQYNVAPTGTTPNWVGYGCDGLVVTPGSIATLDCAGATTTGTLTSGTAASGVSSSVPYTGGNGGSYAAQSVTSTGVTGLTAKLAAGSFATGAGSLTYTITGTPSAGGTASFAINIGGQSCTLSVSVTGPITFANCSTVFNGISMTSQAEYNDGARVIEMVNIGGTNTYNNNLTASPLANWTPQGALYSESNYNDVCTSTKANIHSAATWTNTAINSDVNLSGSGGLVLDLQSFKDVDFIAVYNTPSDGKITHFKIDYSTSATPPSYSNEAAWTNIIPTTQVGDIQPTGNSSVYGCSLTYAMPNRVNARYWRVRVWNTGLHGPTGNSYIEIRQVKLVKFN